jgi:glutathione S-transferase
MTIKLYGVALSNYYCMAKLSLMEKKIDFQEVQSNPSQEADYLSKSPMGKVPCIETAKGFLAETHVIMDYLEDIEPSPALYPSDPFDKATARQAISICELYIELAARRHVGFVLFGAPRSAEAMEQVRPSVESGLRGFARTAKLDPYVCGADFGFADIFAYYTFALAGMVMQAVYDWDIVAEVPGLEACLELTRQRETTRQCDTARQAAIAAYQARSQQR